MRVILEALVQTQGKSRTGLHPVGCHARQHLDCGDTRQLDV